jgi:hypothetical protein
MKHPLEPMARFLLVLKPRMAVAAPQLIDGLAPVLQELQAEIDHRTPAHLSAVLRGGQEHLRMQLFADVQSKVEGPVLELVLMSREAMGQGAPQTHAVFEQLVHLATRQLDGLELRFRSDRDGALPG